LLNALERVRRYDKGFDLNVTAGRLQKRLRRHGRRKTFTEVPYQLEAYRYLQERVHDVWLLDNARQQVRQIMKKIQVQLNQRQEYG